MFYGCLLRRATNNMTVGEAAAAMLPARRTITCAWQSDSYCEIKLYYFTNNEWLFNGSKITHEIMLNIDI